MAADSIHDELFELCPEEDPGYPLIPRSKKQKGACNYDPEPVDQPPNPPPGPAPEESKEEEECVQAPDGPRVKVYPQLAQYDMLSSPAQHCVLGLKHPVRQQVPQTVMHQVPRLQTLKSLNRCNCTNPDRIEMGPHIVLYACQAAASSRNRNSRNQRDYHNTVQASTKENLYCTSIIWCLLFILLWNPFALICYIPAFYYGLKASKEESNSDRALRYQRMEKRFKYGMYFWIIMYILIPPMVLNAIVSRYTHVSIFV